jgi:hypothetical protein
MGDGRGTIHLESFSGDLRLETAGPARKDGATPEVE